MIVRVTAAFVAFAVMVTAFVMYVASLGVRLGPPDDRTNLSLVIEDANNLVVGSSVLLRGVPVGKVDRIDVSTSSASIHFFVDNKFTVPADSVVRLENLSALGESYLELEPQGAEGPAFADGQQVSQDALVAPRSISELGVSVGRMLGQLNPAELQNVVSEADAALPDPYTVLPNWERTSQLLRNTTFGLNGQGRHALDNLQSLLENAGFVGEILASSAGPLGATGAPLHALWNEASSISLRLESPGGVHIIGKLVLRFQKLLDDRGPDIRVLTEPLMPNIQAIVKSLSTIDSSQILTNLLSAVPADGAIELRVSPAAGAGDG